jgi:hypothetical protein
LPGLPGDSLEEGAKAEERALHIDCTHNVEQPDGKPLTEENNAQFASKIKAGTIIRPFE